MEPMVCFPNKVPGHTDILKQGQHMIHLLSLNTFCLQILNQGGGGVPGTLLKTGNHSFIL